MAIVAFAFMFGGKAERIGASVYLMAWLFSVVFQSPGDLRGVQWVMFCTDIVVLAVFGALVWKAPRSWPVWACSLQLLIVVSHVMVMMELKPTISAFYTVINLSGYGIMLAIALGTFFAWQTRKAVGEAYVE